MVKRRRLIIVAGAVLVPCIILAWWFLFRPSGEATPKQQSPANATSTEGAQLAELPKADTNRLESALSSADVAEQGEALAPDLRAEYAATGQAALPPGTKVDIDEATFTQSGTFGEVEAEVSGYGRAVLSLVKVDNLWYVLHTQKK